MVCQALSPQTWVFTVHIGYLFVEGRGMVEKDPEHPNALQCVLLGLHSPKLGCMARVCLVSDRLEILYKRPALNFIT